MTIASPRWRQVAAAVAARIGPHGLQPGERLPTESTLAAEHGVNRHTVRRAIEHLARTGLVRAEQGRGTFVTEERLDYAVETRTRFSEWIRRHNREPAGEVLAVRILEATAQVAAGLGIAVGEAVVMMERLGFADRVPVSLARHFFPEDRLPGIEAALRSAPSITAALERAGIDDYVRAITRTTARLPTGAEAGLLRMPRNRPVLVCENVNTDRAGTPIELGIAIHPSTRVQIVFEPGKETWLPELDSNQRPSD